MIMHVATWWAVLDLAGRFVVAGALAWAALAKLGDLSGLRSTLYLSRLTRPWVPQLTVLLPVLELGLAAVLVLTRPAWLAALGSALLLAAFTVYLALDPHAGEGCTCFGRRSRASRRGGIVRDLLLLTALVPALVRGASAPRRGVPASLEFAFLLVAAVLVGAAVAGAHHRDRAVRAAGRRRAGVPPVPAPVVRVEAPPFDLPALDGSRLGLAPEGVLLFVEPGCDLCAAVLPDVADRADVTALAAGDPRDVAALAARYHLEPGRVAVDEGGRVADAYAVPGTPAACRVSSEGILVDAAGHPTARLAVGLDAVRALLGTSR
jgi:hypothetical protein